MNFQQLRIIRETARRDFNLTEVGNVLFMAPSGVSKHIKDLEDELGVDLFVRRGKRLTGMTEPCKELLPIVERMLLDAENVRKLADRFARRDEGHLNVATTHTQARYALPGVVSAFTAAYPRVHLALHQASPREIVAQLLSGEVDLGIATEAIDTEPRLVSFPYHAWRHVVVVRDDHPLGRIERPTLADVAAFPIVTYSSGYTGRARIDAAFAAAGLSPDVAMSALDADVIKTYVELGLGVGIVASIAYVPGREGRLRLLDTVERFPENVTRIAVRRGHYLRDYGYRFIRMCSDELDEASVRRALNPEREGATE